MLCVTSLHIAIALIVVNRPTNGFVIKEQNIFNTESEISLPTTEVELNAEGTTQRVLKNIDFNSQILPVFEPSHQETRIKRNAGILRTKKKCPEKQVYIFQKCVRVKCINCSSQAHSQIIITV